MSNQSRGRRFENSFATGLGQWSEEHDKDVNVWPCGYSGSNNYPCPDVAITTDGAVYALELKSFSPSKRESGNGWKRCVIDKCDQLLNCANEYTKVGLLIDFANREPYLEIIEGMYVDALRYEYDSDAHAVAEAIDDAFSPMVRNDTTVTVEKPSTDDWSSATKGRDAVQVVIDELGLNEEFKFGRRDDE